LNSFSGHGFYLIPLAAHRAADLLEHFHDLRVVWPFEVQEQAAAARHPRELGHRVSGILLPGAGQPLGQQLVFALPVEDHPGGHHAGGVRGVRVLLFQDVAGVEPHRGVRVHPRGGGVRVLAENAITAKTPRHGERRKMFYHLVSLCLGG